MNWVLEKKKEKKTSIEKKNLSFSGLIVTQNPTLQFLNKGNNRRVSWIHQQHFLGGDNGFDVLQVDDYGPFSTQYGWRVREKRIQDPKVSGRETRSPHDGVLAGLHHLGLAGWVEKEPWAHPGCFLSEADAGGEG